MPRFLLTALLGLVMAGWAVAGAAAQADWGRLESLATGRTMPGPAGWLNWSMCEAGRCPSTQRAERVPASPELLALLARVQAGVNGTLTPRAEPLGRDLWQRGDISGDCEDFALAKEAQLHEAGLPAGAVRLATARLPAGELHAVLTVETDRGTLVLDNLQPRVVPLKSLNYAWLRAQGFDGTLRWRQLSGTPAPDPFRAGWDTARNGTFRAGATGTVDQ